jgi:hypothetical protein
MRMLSCLLIMCIGSGDELLDKILEGTDWANYVSRMAYGAFRCMAVTNCMEVVLPSLSEVDLLVHIHSHNAYTYAI